MEMAPTSRAVFWGGGKSFRGAEILVRVLITWHLNVRKAPPHPLPLSLGGARERKAKRGGRRAGFELGRGPPHYLLLLLSPGGRGGEGDFFWVEPKKVASVPGTGNPGRHSSALGTRHKFNSERNFERVPASGKHWGIELPVDFFPVDPKKGPLF